MNLDRFNPLSMFMGKAPAIQNDSEISDWGIDDLAPSFNNNQPYPIQYNNTVRAISNSYDTYNNHSPYENTANSKSRINLISTNGAPPGDFYSNLQNYRSNTDTVSQFIAQHIRIDSIDHTFWEKFKYNLITSNLLDDSMILSKNEQALANFLRNHPSILNDTCIVNFSVGFDCNFNLILILINLIITLIKSSSNVAVLRLYLSLILKLFHLYKLRLRILSNKNLNQLNQFLLNNYKINKHLISSLIQYKELQVYNFINGGSISDENELAKVKNNLKSNLSNALYFLNFNLVNSISSLFHLINGEVFEQYVSINNINLSIVSDQDKEFTSPLDEIVYLINKFNQLRKLFICQLLSINEKNNKKNFFVYQIMDNFNLSEGMEVRKNLVDKLISIANIFQEHNKVLVNFNQMFDRFSETNTWRKQSHDNEDILDIGNSEKEIDTNLLGLIEKLDSLSTNLKYFHKYNQSTKTINNVDELNEKMMIFNQFNDELLKVKELYQLSLNDLNHDIYLAQKCMLISSTEGSSVRSPQSESGEFNLKSFHNSAIKKRYSLPSATPNSISGLASPIQKVDKPKDRSNGNSSGKKYKRLSAGLALGLLTVVEEQTDTKSKANASKSSDSNSTHVSYDDNYINILPPQSYETYNQSTLDQLSNNSKAKKFSLSSRNSYRFSLNSMCSNVSGVTDMISSTQLTNYDDADNDELHDDAGAVPQISKEDLKLKLEESFNRIYNLENENKILKLNRPDEPGIGNNDTRKIKFNTNETDMKQGNANSAEPTEDIGLNRVDKTLRKQRSKSMMVDPSFLNELEQTLNK